MGPVEGVSNGSSGAAKSIGKAAKVTDDRDSNSSSSGDNSSKRGGLVKKKLTTATVRHIVSVGQFRPEKDHPLQLHAFALLLEELKPEEGEVTDAI